MKDKVNKFSSLCFDEILQKNIISKTASKLIMNNITAQPQTAARALIMLMVVVNVGISAGCKNA